MSKLFYIFRILGVKNGSKWSQIGKLLLIKGVKLLRKESQFFGEFCFTSMIFLVLVLQYALVKRCFVSRMRFFKDNFFSQDYFFFFSLYQLGFGLMTPAKPGFFIDLALWEPPVTYAALLMLEDAANTQKNTAFGRPLNLLQSAANTANTTALYRCILPLHFIVHHNTAILYLYILPHLLHIHPHLHLQLHLKVQLHLQHHLHL